MKPIESRPTLRVAVVVASAGRPSLLQLVINNLNEQSVGFTKIISVPDVVSLPSYREGWSVVLGPRGLAAQRNSGVASLTDVDLVFFFDDDALVRSDYIENAVRFFASEPTVIGMTGRVLLDGARTGEIDSQTALDTLKDSFAQPLTGSWRRVRELYGCNFAFRVTSTEVRFDERLPLYSWLEDHDFARRLMQHGALARVADCVIVHRAAASGGRQAHIRLGYSQVMNPVHLWCKRSFPVWLAVYEIIRPVAKNIIRSPFGKEAEWRRKRLRGNILAARDAFRGRITPERITEL